MIRFCYELEDWLTQQQHEPQAQLSIQGNALIYDVYMRYQLLDLQKPLLLTFAPAGTHAVTERDLHEDYSPWGFDIAANENINVIAFQHLGQGNWFRSRAFLLFLEQLAELISPFAIKLGYGLSRGGFAVSAFSELLKFDQVLLFHPVSSKNPQIAPWDDRDSIEYFSQQPWDGAYNDIALGQAKGYVVYDPLDRIDCRHAKRYPSLTHLRVFGMGHATHASFLSQFGFFKQALLDFIHQQHIDLTKFRLQTRSLRLKEEYYQQLNQANRHSSYRLKQLQKAHRILKQEHAAQLAKQQAEINISPLIDIALKHEDAHPQDAKQLLQIAQQIVPEHPLIEQKLKDMA